MGALKGEGSFTGFLLPFSYEKGIMADKNFILKLFLWESHSIIG